MNPLFVIDDYLRIVAYTIVILTDLIAIYGKKVRPYLVIGDLLLGFALLTMVIHKNFFHVSTDLIEFGLFTPAVLVWAGLHFYNLMFRKPS